VAAEFLAGTSAFIVGSGLARDGTKAKSCSLLSEARRYLSLAQADMPAGLEQHPDAVKPMLSSLRRLMPTVEKASKVYCRSPKTVSNEASSMGLGKVERRAHAYRPGLTSLAIPTSRRISLVSREKRGTKSSRSVAIRHGTEVSVTLTAPAERRPVAAKSSRRKASHPKRYSATIKEIEAIGATIGKRSNEQRILSESVIRLPVLNQDNDSRIQRIARGGIRNEELASVRRIIQYSDLSNIDIGPAEKRRGRRVAVWSSCTRMRRRSVLRASS